MQDDDIIRDEDPEAALPLEDDELVDGKKKLLDDEVESADDLAEEEESDVEPFDDVNLQ